LKGEGNDATGLELGASGGEDADSIGASIGLMGETFDPAGCRHPFEEGSDGIGIGRHECGEFALGEAVGTGFDEGSEGGELVWGDAGVGDAAAEGLIEAVPGFAEDRREAADLGRRILRREGLGLGKQGELLA
jgi:hypothetical protein